MHGPHFHVTGTDGGWVPPSARWPEVTTDVGVGQMRVLEFEAMAGDSDCMVMGDKGMADMGSMTMPVAPEHAADDAGMGPLRPDGATASRSGAPGRRGDAPRAQAVGRARRPLTTVDAGEDHRPMQGARSPLPDTTVRGRCDGTRVPNSLAGRTMSTGITKSRTSHTSSMLHVRESDAAMRDQGIVRVLSCMTLSR